MSGSVWYISISKKKIEFKKYPAHKKNQKNNKKKTIKNFVLTLIFLFSFIFFLNNISADPINDTFHINLQTTNSTSGTAGIETGTFAFTFNITDNSSSLCGSNVVYNYSTVLNTDSRGIVSLYLPTIGSGGGNLSNLSYDTQYYLCYSRNSSDTSINGSVIVSQLGRVPYSFRATQVNLSEVNVNTNLSLGNFNASGNYGFFSFLGSLASRISGIFAINTNILNNLSVGGNFSVNNSALFVNGNTSFVGIGTPAPNQSLDVIGNIQASGAFQSTSNNIIYAGSPLGQVQFFRPPTTNDIALYAGGTERLRINDTTGNVGINTTSPQNTLNVIGTFNVTGAAAFGNSICSSGQVLSTDSSGQLVCVAASSLNGVVNGSGTAGYIPVWNSTSSINNSVIYQNGSKIGIGTTTPSENLSVVGNIQTTGAFQTDSNNIIYAGSPLGQVQFFRPPTTNDIALYAGGTERLRINDTSGNVGINTTSPQNKLNVLGDINATTSIFAQNTKNLSIGYDYATNGTYLTSEPNWNANYSNFSTIYGYALNETNWYGNSTGAFKVNVTAGNFNITSGYFNISNQTTSGLFFVNGTNGRVGIGTTNPTTTLDVRGGEYIARNDNSHNVLLLQQSNASLNTDIFMTNANTGSNSSIISRRNTGELWIYNSQSDPIKFYTGGTYRAIIDATGNVGINTTTPQNTLNVIGTLNVTNGTNSIAGLVLDSNNRVGIGTSSPSGRLHTTGGDVIIEI